MSKRPNRKPISRTGVVLLVACGVLVLIAQALISAGVDLGWIGKVAMWTCGVLAVLSLLEPLLWLFRLARGGSPWDV